MCRLFYYRVCSSILLPCMLVLYSSAVVYFSIALTISGSCLLKDRHDFVGTGLVKGLAYYCEGGRGCWAMHRLRRLCTCPRRTS
jgi:hypothetical protein